MKSRIGTEGVTFRLLGRPGQAGIGNHLTFRRYKVCPPLDLLDLTNRNLIEVNHLTDDMCLLWFLGEKITTTGNPML